DPSRGTVELCVDEVGALRGALGLERLSLLGQSCGGMLAMEYALTRPTGLAGLIIASSPASMRRWVAVASRLRAGLPAEVQQTLLFLSEVERPRRAWPREAGCASPASASASRSEAVDSLRRRAVCRAA